VKAFELHEKTQEVKEHARKAVAVMSAEGERYDFSRVLGQLPPGAFDVFGC